MKTSLRFLIAFGYLNLLFNVLTLTGGLGTPSNRAVIIISICFWWNIILTVVNTLLYKLVCKPAPSSLT